MRQKLLFVTLIAIALAYIESSVVVYLRAILYPYGFHFPIKAIPSLFLMVEVGREVATIVLLFGLALLAGKTRPQRYAYFFLAFGVWDIFYYIWLKIFINWPESFLTWDILFLIPLPWTSPVISPILVSLALISAALVILFYEQRSGQSFHPNPWEWAGELLAGLIILTSYLWNVNKLATDEQLLNYPYWLFFSGLLLGIIIFAAHIQKQYLKKN